MTIKTPWYRLDEEHYTVILTHSKLYTLDHILSLRRQAALTHKVRTEHVFFNSFSYLGNSPLELNKGVLYID